jgi:hypothetical protein
LYWFQANYKRLKKKYNGEYVAVKNRRVVGHAKDVQWLLDRMKAKHEDLSSLLVEPIHDLRKEEFVLY